MLTFKRRAFHVLVKTLVMKHMGTVHVLYIQLIPYVLCDLKYCGKYIKQYRVINTLLSYRYFLFKTFQIVHSLQWNNTNINIELPWNTHKNIVVHAQTFGSRRKMFCNLGGVLRYNIILVQKSYKYSYFSACIFKISV